MRAPGFVSLLLLLAAVVAVLLVTGQGARLWAAVTPDPFAADTSGVETLPRTGLPPPAPSASGTGAGAARMAEEGVYQNEALSRAARDLGR